MIITLFTPQGDLNFLAEEKVAAEEILKAMQDDIAFYYHSDKEDGRVTFEQYAQIPVHNCIFTRALGLKRISNKIKTECSYMFCKAPLFFKKGGVYA